MKIETNKCGKSSKSPARTKLQFSESEGGGPIVKESQLSRCNIEGAERQEVRIKWKKIISTEEAAVYSEKNHQKEKNILAFQRRKRKAAQVTTRPAT